MISNCDEAAELWHSFSSGLIYIFNPVVPCKSSLEH